MGFVPFFVVLCGFLFLVLSLCYYSLRNYRSLVSANLQSIRVLRDKIRSEVDEFEFLSVPELESLCESLCNNLTGNISPQQLEEKLLRVNQEFTQLYRGTESKHIQEELLQTINTDVRKIEKLALEANHAARSYEKLRMEKPYSFAARLFGFEKLNEAGIC